MQSLGQKKTMKTSEMQRLYTTIVFHYCNNNCYPYYYYSYSLDLEEDTGARRGETPYPRLPGQQCSQIPRQAS